MKKNYTRIIKPFQYNFKNLVTKFMKKSFYNYRIFLLFLLFPIFALSQQNPKNDLSDPNSNETQSVVFNLKSSPQSDYWQNTNIPYNSWIISMAINSSDQVFAGTNNGGVYRSTDNGGSWVQINSGLTILNTMALAINSSGNVFVGTTTGGVFRSLDFGNSWTQNRSGLGTGIVWALAVNSSGQIFAGLYGGGVYRSTNNGDSWTQINNGLTETSVMTLFITPDGQIFVGTLNGKLFRSTNNGDNWTQVGSGLPAKPVMCMTINSSGQLFTGIDTYGVYKSTDNGSNWTLSNTGITNNTVEALTINSSGHLFAGTGGGVFRSLDNGNTWSLLNDGLTNTYIYSLATNSTGIVYVGTGNGIFRSILSTTAAITAPILVSPSNNSTYVLTSPTLIWNSVSGASSYRVQVATDTSFNTIIKDSIVNDTTKRFTSLSSNTKYYWRVCVNGITSPGPWSSVWNFTTAPSSPNDIYWDDRFTSTNAPDGGTYTVEASGTDIYVGGWFLNAGGVPAKHIAKWNGTTWSALGNGVDTNVRAIAVLGNDVYVGGIFTSASGVANTAYIAKWNTVTNTWSALGSGVNGAVYSIIVSGGNVYVGGGFTTAGGITVNNIAKWNGSNWSALGTGVNSSVLCLAVISNGDIYAGGNFTTAGGQTANRVAKWNGSSWSALGTGLNNIIWAITTSGNNVYAGGDFTNAGGVSVNYIAKWDGTSWSALGSGADNRVTAATANGSDIYFGGWFTSAGGIANTSHIAKWDGTSWSSLGSGVNDRIFDISIQNNDIWVCGNLTVAGGKPSNFFGRYGPPVTQQPVLSVNPNSFSFTAQQNAQLPSSQSLSISNAGSGTLIWNITKNSSWLVVNPTSGTGSGTVIVSVNTTNLNPGTYRDTITVTDAGALNSPQQVVVTYTITAITGPATITSPQATVITSNSATLGANVTSDGNLTIMERGIVWATTANPTTSNNKVIAPGSTGTFTVNVTGLSSFTTYHYRGYVINSAGTSYTSDASFTTLPFVSSPIITDPKASNITSNSVTLGANVVSDGGSTITERGIVWGPLPNPTLLNNKVVASGTLGSFTVDVTGLSLNRTYHYRGFATNSAGTSYTSDSSFTTLSSQPTIVRFNDTNLETVVRGALNKPTGDITNQDMAIFTSLTAFNKGITDLTGLEHAINLTGLYLDSNKISNLSPIANLTILSTLSLSYNSISDIQALSNLTKLGVLTLNSNQIKTISSIANLIELITLGLSNNQISDITSLSNLNKLTGLSLSDNQISDLSPLANLTSIKNLYLGNNQIKNIASLAGMINLNQLILYMNQISDLNSLSNMLKLSWLELAYNQITSIDALRNLTSLTVLTLWSNQISDITAISNLTNLTDLLLYNNKLDDNDLPNLYNLKLLSNHMGDGTLNLRGNLGFTEAAIRALDAQLPLIDYDHILWDASSTTVHFNDAILESEVRKALNKLTGDITNSDMATLTTLSADEKGIKDLTGLEYATNLNSLSLNRNPIINVTLISGLTNLTDLFIDSIQINSINFLSKLINLKSLSISLNSISNLDSLANLKNLTALTAAWNIIGSIDGIKNLTGLTDIHLWSNKISDISALSNLINLKAISLHDNNISDVNPLKNLTNLTYLTLYSNKIKDISPLANMTKLVQLFLQINQISDISTLKNLTNLNTLQLDQNQIVDISPLSNLVNLVDLEIGENQISNIKPLSGLTNLSTLWLWSNQISDISALSNLTNLSVLGFPNNQISSISPLSNLTKLSYLNIYSNKISDINPLSNLTKLSFLNLVGNQVTDVNALTNLTNLDTLSLGGNKITHIDALSNLTKISFLSIRGNQISNIDALSKMTGLKNLYLHDNIVSDISVLSKLTNLNILYLYNNLISDLNALSGMTNLTDLVLSGNRLNDASLPSLYSLKKLSNKNVETSIGDQKIVGYLDLRNNIGFSQQAIQSLDNQLPLIDYDHILWEPTGIKKILADFPFNGNANDLSSYGNNGVVYGAKLTNDHFDNQNSAYYFDGVSNYIDAGYNNSLRPYKNLTISAWVYIDSLVGFGGIGNVFDTYYNESGYGLYFVDSTTYFIVKTTGKSAWWNRGVINTPFEECKKIISPYEWHHIAGVYDGSKARLFFDGIKVNESNADGTIIYTPSNNFRIGAYIDDAEQEYFKGIMDDIRIYNYDLTDQEIAELYFSGKAPLLKSCSITNVTSTSVTFKSDVNPNSDPTSAWFEYDPGMRLIHYYSTPQKSIGSDTVLTTITETVTGLTPDTKFYYRAAAKNSYGTRRGVIQSFTTGKQSSSIAINKTSLSFSAVKNSSLPKSENILISHDYKQSITFTKTQSWLDCSLTSGDTNSSISVSVNTTNLNPGTQIDTIKVIAPGALNSPQAVVVTYSILSIPYVAITTQSNIADPGSDKTISFSSTGGAQPKSITAFYRMGGAGTYDSIAVTYSNNNYSFTIPKEKITSRGIDYYLKGYFDGLTTSLPESNNLDTQYAIQVKLNSSISSQVFYKKKYSMSTVPLEPDGKYFIDEIIRNLGPVNNSVWRIFKYRLNNYEEYAGGAVWDIKPGDGFWLITKDNKTLEFQNCLTTVTNKSYKIRLGPGWNQIGNPFLFRMPNTSIIFPEGKKIEKTLWRWIQDDEAYNDLKQTELLEYWEGYFIKNNEPDSVDIYFNPVYANSILAKENSQRIFEKDEWKINISISENDNNLNQSRNSAVEIGCLKDSKDEWDVNDADVPPPSPSNDIIAIGSNRSLQIQFPHNDWTEFKGNYIKDFKSISKDGQSWEMEIINNGGSRIDNCALTLSKIGNLPENFEICIYDYDLMSVLSSRSSVNNGNDSYSYSIRFNENQIKKSIKIMIGSKEYIAQEIKTAKEEKNFELSKYILMQNYPNPFNPVTRIEYSLPENAYVTLKIYNSLGQEIEILVNKNQAAGKYSVEWHPNSTAGGLPSGIYYYKLQTGSFSDMKKMMYLR
jgi:Leucine-rich repeat (LRR) protein